MDIQSIIAKAQSEELTEDEKKAFAEAVISDLESLKKSNPGRYFIFLKQINATLKKLNNTLNKI